MPKLTLDQAKSWATILLPVIVGIVGFSITCSVSNSEIEARYVEIAVDVLNQEPSKLSRPVRQWAVEIIREYSPVEMDQPTALLLTDTISLGSYWGDLSDTTGLFQIILAPPNDSN